MCTGGTYRMDEGILYEEDSGNPVSVVDVAGDSVADSGALIYTGPGSVKLGLRHYGVYVRPLPEYLSAMCEKYEAIGSAFVDVETFATGEGYPVEGSPEYQELTGLIRRIEVKKA